MDVQDGWALNAGSDTEGGGKEMGERSEEEKRREGRVGNKVGKWKSKVEGRRERAQSCASIAPTENQSSGRLLHDTTARTTPTRVQGQAAR